jgi:peroxiredoxin
MKTNYLIFLLLISGSVFAQIAETPGEISPLLIGEKVPETEIVSVESLNIPLMEIVSKKPSILLFYRGGWCPFCNAHLAEVGEITLEISELGYQIIAISPDSPEKLKESLSEQNLDYELFSDSNGNLTQAMGLAFKSPEKYGSMLSTVSNGKNPGFLPVPAIFVLDTEGTILFEYISPDYKQRIAAPLLLDVLKHFSAK